ncbi:MAG: cell division protein FtsA [Candidatus Levybacteria bacterium RIFCSPHIGHO2_02_FULL_40_18]|nr:MAG: cell division protein FtsA [Candidatus Levybacteria bacterium RIFCSPHIGHO2_01_FULL_40_58]OGH27137.1 MAG: cell division protein FtsA [Candidatus Levybacteria bacterium RIFCSPHIGHO2_02_FULL_40_18]OGH30996.1 MAG: cell division protein FtsA [Candidatus Levybacteria bacterium RIFCSPHIGHO2_12_FULL_40_31]OGH41007.1 MAG: cell division protein FtsA [Candidatus Levybacteria bacterium RIFCSPLOWO2_01_FULL_40_64]OGH48917.1 MAG: cell division protein FtsA [Candidatus Levybacteria bacterium RIFCSPLOWO
MADSQIVVGVDIGSSKVAAIVGQLQEDGINILGVSEVPARGIRKGQIVDIEEASSSINASLDQAERMAGYSVDRVFVSLSGVYILSQNSKGIVAISQPSGEIGPQDVQRVLEAAGAISTPSTTSILHVLPKTFTVDGETGIRDPVGMTGVRLEVDTHIITANSVSVKNVQRVLEQEAGVGVSSVVFSGLASSLAVLTETERELGAILVDIGAGITNICIYVEGALSYSSVIPIGARHITNDLAIGLRISLESAEKIKLYLSRKYGKKSKEATGPDAAPEGSARREGLRPSGEEGSSDDIDLAGLHLIEDLKKVSQKTLVDGIIKPRLNELFTMVGIELKKSGFATQTPAGVVITGGGARTAGAEESAKRMLSMPVRVGIPANVTGLIDDIENPSFATSVGLLFFAKGFQGQEEGSFLDGILRPLNLNFTRGIFGSITKLLKTFLPK